MSRSENKENKGLFNLRDQCGLRQFLKFSELHILLSASENTLNGQNEKCSHRLRRVNIWSPAAGITGGDCGTLRAWRLAEDVHHGREVGLKSLYSLSYFQFTLSASCVIKCDQPSFLFQLPSSPLWAPPLGL